jgi:DNA repair protein RecN (Recombination protein N)
MLAFKTLSALRSEQSAPGSRTLIFDEVDAGIGGRVADVVGERLQALGQRFQVLCITHLPQIAARATVQFRISKSVRQGRTATAVELLDEGGRITELARMMSGAAVTDAGRQSARELLARGLAAGERRKRK